MAQPPKDEYVDLAMIECNRLSGIHPDENNAVWTNNLANTFHMKPGDRVSMYGSFISERGSGQIGSIQIQGNTLGKKKKIKYNVIEELELYSIPFRRNIPQGEKLKVIEEEIEMLDNKCSMIINFYKTMDLLNYVQLPRRFYKDPVAGTGGTTSWTNEDSIALGRTHSEVAEVGAGVSILDGYNIIREDYSVQPHKTDMYNIKWFLKNDNTKYTIMCREDVPFLFNPNGAYQMTWYEASTIHSVIVKVVNNFGPFYFPRVGDTTVTTGNRIERIITTTTEYIELELAFGENISKGDIVDATNPNDALPEYYRRDPENANYHVVRNKIEIDLPKGFSSASILSNEITRQLQKTTDIDTQFNIGSVVNPTINSEIPITKTLESNTYKTFNATNPYYSDESKYEEIFLNSNTTTDNTDPVFPNPFPVALFNYTPTNSQNVTDWYRGYQYIAIKRPEIYETGCKINDIMGLKVMNGLERYDTVVLYAPTIPTDTELICVNTTYADNHIEIGWFINNGIKNIKITNIVYTPSPDGFVADTITLTLEEPWGQTTGSGGGGVISSTYTGEKITTANKHTSPIILSLEYNESNCLLLKNYFEATAKYPELYSRDNVSRLWVTVGNVNEYMDGTTPLIDINNSRFLHMNEFPNSQMNNGRKDDALLTAIDLPSKTTDETYGIVFKEDECTQLGNSFYDTVGLTGAYQSVPVDPVANPITLANTPVRNLTDRKGSRPVFFHYDPKQKDTFYQNPNPDDDTYTYGCLGTSGKYITIYPNKILKPDGTGVGIPPYFFHTSEITPRRKIGFDRHFNAWSTCAIQLANGNPSTGYIEDDADGGQIDPHEQSQPAIFDIGAGNINYDQSQFINQVYLGATSPTVGFDGAHFFFEDLHSPLLKGNFDSKVIDESSDSNTIVYKMNPSQAFNNYTPTQFPYQKSKIWDSNGGEQGGLIEVYPLNPNVDPYAIYDCTTGIFIEDFGYTQEKWDNSIWGALGFTYDQLHGVNLVRNDRVDFKNQDSLSLVTTNSQLDSVDTKSWAMWPTGSAIFDGSVVNNYNVHYKGLTPGDVDITGRFVPEIIVPAKSIRINAKEYPVSMDVGYYTIRSDIVPNTAFLGGPSANTSMPIVGVVDKMNPQGDFYFGSESSLEFMITKPTILSSISVSIHDPDGSYANASRRSAVIFKIQRLRRLTFDINSEIQEILKEKKKKKK